MAQADKIILNAKVLTMDPANATAQALAIAGDTILAVGSGDEIEAMAAPDARRIDARGATVMPGFVEAHLHLFMGSMGRRLLQLGDVEGLPALRKALQGYAKDNPDEGLLFCKGASYNLFGDGIMTTRQMIDEALADRPVLLMSDDHHTCWANTIALEKAGILHGKDTAVGTEVVMADDGTAAGELREYDAYESVMKLRTSGGRESLGMDGLEPGPLTDAQREEDIEVLTEGLNYCASFGFTSLHNMDGNRYQLELLAEIERRGDLVCRIEVPFHLTPSKPLETLEEASAMQADFQTSHLKCNRVKMFMDGVIDSGTAYVIDGYADQPDWCSDPLHSQERFNAAAIDIDRRGLQISVHAIGDAAVRSVLDGYAAAEAANGKRDSRHRIEHIEMIDPSDLDRVRDLGVVASMQPSHPPGAMDFPLQPWVSKVGPKRLAHAFPVQYLRDRGVKIAFASDWPVADVDPMRGVQAAVTRKAWQAGDPSHASTLMEALHDYTAGGIYAGHDEDRLGRLAPGLQADIVVMDHDLEAMPVEELGTARAALTLCAGRVTWEA
ncbi:amidohydrolase [Chachezhania antarctica]|uniref:amidohydrolase n=1 Tax=Chachezhania antarctica TaxID=2340860 RepID=UPI000EACC659|nr:amidohydrolase [Chachezhania antarctica]|tara:strand:- start:200 stop:1861 length:1662 start_codon:yes stop_codon:yes gene_type:complete